jgi:16S rRNA (cytosine1402-N4)-methyltransferase
MDRDPAARRRAEALEREFGAAFRFVPGDFADCAAALADLPPRGAGAPDDRGDRPLDGALLDLGLSSFQLADPGRGFAFSQDGPLDMRFDPDEGGPTAAEVVNRYPEERLRQVLFDLGQESWAARIAAAVVRERRKAPLLTTSELASLVARVIPRPKWPRRIHPATRTFQALRMEVNDELGSLRRGLEEIERHLRPGGRFGVISFHSLEDKAVKRFFDVESRDCICPPRQPVCTCGHRAGVIILTPHPARPSEDEVDLNPRSRSARLRVAQRLP